MPTEPIGIKRRSFLALLGSTAIASGTGLPRIALAASSGGDYAPPSLMKSTGDPYLTKYKESLEAFITFIGKQPEGSTKERLYDTSVTTADAKLVSAVYALSAGSRPIPMSNGSSNYTIMSPSYQDLTDLNTSAPNVGPTMEFKRGSVTSVWLENSITVCGKNPRASTITPVTKLGFTPHNFDYTNLHTHGLHVEPNAPSDDVLVTVKPSGATDDPHEGHGDHGGHSAHMEAITAANPTTFPYYYDIQKNHPVGTFWYHPHMHGAVAAQVGPGMAGALLMRSGSDEIDFDEILEIECNIMKPNPSAATVEEQWGDERVIVIQGFQSVYSITGTTTTTPAVDGAFVADALYSGSLDPDHLSCVGGTLSTEIATSIGSGDNEVQMLWVNGTYQPTLKMKKGEILRFRMINATNGQTVIPKIKATGTNTTLPKVYAIGVDGITLLPIASGGSNLISLPWRDDPSFAESEDRKEELSRWQDETSQYSDDTHYFEIDYSVSDPSSPSYWTTAEIINMAPAQRLDILVKAPDAVGQYELYGASTSEAPTVVGSGNSVNTSTILKIEVVDEERTDNVPQSIPTMSLFDNSKLPTYPKLATAKIERPPMMPTAFPTSIATQSQWFGYVGDANMETVGNFQINGSTFNANLARDAQLVLFEDQLTAWELYSANGPHIMHIHINSFAVHGRYTVETTPLVPAEPNNKWGWPYAQDGTWPTAKTIKPYLMPIWRDTVYFDSADGGSTPEDKAVAGDRVFATSFQQDYTGEFVMHCHSLYHEDNGMMHTVQIKPPA